MIGYGQIKQTFHKIFLVLITNWLRIKSRKSVSLNWSSDTDRLLLAIKSDKIGSPDEAATYSAMVYTMIARNKWVYRFKVHENRPD